MKNFIYSQKYERIVPIIARVVFGLFFLFAAISKIPGTAMFANSVVATEQAGIPFPALAIILALILEVAAGASLITGYYSKVAGAILVPYIVLLTVLFHMSFTSQTDVGFFVDHILLIAGLLYVSAYGPDRKK